jgi:hypothetical protein
MSLEDRLRAAMRAETSRVEPDDLTSLTSIGIGTRARAVRHRRRAVVGATLAALIVAAGLVIAPHFEANKQTVRLTNEPARPTSPTTTTVTIQPNTTIITATPETTVELPRSGGHGL